MCNKAETIRSMNQLLRFVHSSTDMVIAQSRARRVHQKTCNTVSGERKIILPQESWATMKQRGIVCRFVVTGYAPMWLIYNVSNTIVNVK